MTRAGGLTPVWARPTCSVCASNLSARTRAEELPGLEVLVAKGRAREVTHFARTLEANSAEDGTETYDQIRSQPHIRYRFCGDGHAFFAGYHPGGPEAAYGGAVDSQVVAMVGSPASGKSYLLARTLGQRLSMQPRIEGRVVDAVEGTVFTGLMQEYAKAVSQGTSLSATGILRETPGALWPFRLHSDLWQSIVKLTGLSDEDLRERWTGSLFQPLTRSYRIDSRDSRSGEHDVLLAVADLAGEHFVRGMDLIAELDALQLGYVLSGFDALVWAIDPAVCHSFLDWSHWDRAKIFGSVRPELNREEQTEEDRDEYQWQIAGQLGGLAEFNTEQGGTQDVLVTVTKADLFHEVLGNQRESFRELGGDSFVRGVERYLQYLCLRDPNAGRVVLGGHVDATRIASFAGHLVDALSEPDNYWSLVETGRPFELRVAGTNVHNPGWTLPVESIDGYLQALRDNPNTDHPRSVIMSALGCGLVCALGFADSVDGLLDQHNRRVAFFVTSAMGAVPKAERRTDGNGYRVTPDDGQGRPSRFPSARESSAALTQLHAALLRRCLQ